MFTITARFNGYCYGILSKQVKRLWTPDLDVCIAISKIQVCNFVSILFFALAGSLVRSISGLTGIEETAARGVLLRLLDGIHYFVQTLWIFWIFFDCTVNPVKAYFAYILSVEVDWPAEKSTSWFTENTATENRNLLPPSFICGQKRALVGSFIARNVWVFLVRFAKSHLMTISETCNAAEAAGAQID